MVVRPRAMQGFPPAPPPRPKVPSMIRGKKEDGLLRNFPFFTNIPITGDAHGRGDGLLDDCPGNRQSTRVSRGNSVNIGVVSKMEVPA